MPQKKILVLAPHPDDEVLGCGGTLRKYANIGADIILCLVTESQMPEYSESYIAQKKEEIKKSCSALGINTIIDLQFPTAKHEALSPKAIIEKITEVIATHSPDTLFIPHCGDLHIEHRLVCESALVAARPSLKQSIRRIFAYETPSETEWGIVPFWPNYYEDISSTIGNKLEAIRAYQTELRAFPHPRSTEVIEALAKKRGSEAGVSAAEAFMLVRSVS